MRPDIQRLTTAQLTALLRTVTLTRKVDAVHLHHTWRPTRAQFRGLATIEAMRAFHVETNGWDDIAQHLTIDPQGVSWTGRNWNLPPASQRGRNGTRQAGPFMIEMVGDFDAGRELLDGDQRQAVVEVVAALLDAFGLTTTAIHFHRDLGSPKTCPGSGVDKAELLKEIQAAKATIARSATRPRGKAAKRTAKARAADDALPFLARFVLGGDVAADPGDAAPGFEAWEIPETDFAARDVREIARHFRAARATESLAATLARTRSEWDPLREHVVNLSQGRLSRGGEFEMEEDSIERIIEAIRAHAASVPNPRVMMHAHGGLVSERSALKYALGAHKWWLDQGVFPVYFIWETSVFEIIKNRLGLSRGFGDWWDRRFEDFARPIGKPLWSEMKEYALLASSEDAGEGEAGGARIFAQALSALIHEPLGGRDITLHAVGHSAGAIFHTHFVPLLNSMNVTVESLAFLAPAVRIDLFKQMLLPALTSGDVDHFEMYTMDEEAEKDDDLIEALGIPIYGKSLLYLVSGAFEPEEDAGILGLDERFRDDSVVTDLFAPTGPHRLEFSHAKGKPHNPATKSRKHGCFDNDDATMKSVFATITGTPTDLQFAAIDPDCVKASSRALEGWLPTGPRAFVGPYVAATTPAFRSAVPGRAGRALCVGIDSYPTSPLAGCVRDAETWTRILRDLGFEVTSVLDTQATRQRVLDALSGLVDAAAPGDLLVFQYSGHGTQAKDLNGDEADRYDEALVPIDYDRGALLLDDDLADIYRRVPEGAVLTLFMDCCHSGTNSRFAPLDRAGSDGDVRRRFLPLTAEQEEAHRRFRARAGSPAPTTPEESLPGIIHFAACLDNQYAYESSGQGHFTGVATADLAAAVAAQTTNEDFGGAVAAKVISLGRPQTPRLMRLAADLAGRPLLARMASAPDTGIAPHAALTPGGSVDQRAMDEWCLQFFEAGVAHWRQRLGR